MRPLAAALARQEFAAAETPAMDEETFRLFYNRTARPLRAYIGATLHDYSLADDIMQESFLRLLQAGLPAAIEEEHRKNYLFRIATNLMRDHFRSVKNVPLGDSASGETLGEEIAQRQDMRRIMEELNPKQRELLWLAYVERFSHGEIAGMVGAKTESIRPMLARARHSLAELLRRRTGVST
ncbi:MAG TPA: RNA polymerase sigma factor [Bryobacteraceae bacterium]|jgi:RNA polymerase sigma-70 factor (ECF subfamily)|nr:RNA polymerase sigma factor [Bryobacteraceae bacterium]